jgi:hypothetical protein
MTSEPDNKAGRRVPTIELRATQIENPAAGQEGAATERAASEQEPPQAASQDAGARPYASRIAIGAAIAVVVIAAIGAGLWLEGFGFPGEATPPAATTPAAAPPVATASGMAAPSSAALDEIAARLDKLEHAIQAPRPETALGNRLVAAEAQNKALGESLAALNRRIDGVATASQSAAKQADAAIAAADAAKNTALSAGQKGVQPADVDALAERITALESAVKGIADNAARQASSADDTAARLTIAAQALRAAVERDMPYQAELTAVQSLGADRNTVAPLEPFAANGVPNANGLAHELAALMPSLEQASDTAPGDKTFIERLEANAQKLVRVTPINAPTGNDPAAVTARIAFDTARTDIAAALTDIAALPNAAKPLVADWVKKAQAREAAITASRRIAADALAALSKPAAQ